MAETNAQICARLDEIAKDQRNGIQEMEASVGRYNSDISTQQHSINELEREERIAESEKNSARLAVTLGGRLRLRAPGTAAATAALTRAEIKLTNIRAKLSSAKSRLSNLIRQRDRFQKELNNFRGNLPTTIAEMNARGC